VMFTSAQLYYANVYRWVGTAGVLADLSNFGLLGSKLHKKLRFPALDADNCSAKYDATSFILGREIHNRKNTQKTSARVDN